MSDRSYEAMGNIVRQLCEREGVSGSLERDVSMRESSLFLTLRPRTFHHRTNISDNAIEDTMPIAIVDDLQGRIEDAAKVMRGAAIAELASRPFVIKHPRHAKDLDVHSSLVTGLMSALDHCGELSPEASDLIARRLEHILTKHGDSATCERTALRLMERVEVVPR